MTESPPTEQEKERLYEVGAGMCIASVSISIGYFVETFGITLPEITPTVLSISIMTGMCLALIYVANHEALVGVVENAD